MQEPFTNIGQSLLLLIMAVISHRPKAGLGDDDMLRCDANEWYPAYEYQNYWRDRFE